MTVHKARGALVVMIAGLFVVLASTVAFAAPASSSDVDQSDPSGAEAVAAATAAEADDEGPCGPDPCSTDDESTEGPCGPDPCPTDDESAEGACGPDPCTPHDETVEGPCGADPCPPPGDSDEGPCGPDPCTNDATAEGPCGTGPCDDDDGSGEERVDGDSAEDAVEPELTDQAQAGDADDSPPDDEAEAVAQVGDGSGASQQLTGSDWLEVAGARGSSPLVWSIALTALLAGLLTVTVAVRRRSRRRPDTEGA